MSDDKALREHLSELLTGEHAHAGFSSVVADLPPESRGVKTEVFPHTPWQLLEHLRIAQRDILDFSRDPDYEAPNWPDGYWPETPAPPDEAAWDHAVASFRADLETFVALVRDPATDLFAPIPWGTGQTVLREALLIADHNAYHLGQLVDVRRALGCWPPGEA